MPHQQLGLVRCPACGQKALPLQTRCVYCNARLNEVLPAEQAGEAIQPSTPVSLPPADGKCPGCAKELAAAAVLCIECGYDVRTGQKRETVYAVTEEEPGPNAPRRMRKRGREQLPAGLGKVQLGLGFHYARLVLTLLAVLVMLGLLCYGVTVRPRPDDLGLVIVGLAAVGIAQLAAGLGLVGSVLCLWVGRGSRAWWFIFASLLLDGLTLPLVIYLQIAALPPLIAWVVEFVSWLLFMLFLRQLALDVDRPDEADEVMALIIRGVALLVGVPLLLVLLALFAFLYGTFSKATARWILAVSVLILVVWFILVIKLFFSVLGNIQTLRATITSRLPGKEATRPDRLLRAGLRKE
jgi:hypothetical protein